MLRPGWPAGSIPPELGDAVSKGCSWSEETPGAVACTGLRHHWGEQRVSLAFKC